MEIIKELAPSLYQEIVAVDPSAINHIVLDDALGKTNMAVVPTYKDGLPKIFVGSVVSQFPREYLKASIAHELGHYVLGHFSFSPDSVSQKILQRAFSRSQESEADRFAIMEFGVNIDDAIAEAKALSALSKKASSASALQATHPFWQTRIQHLEELRREIEAQRRKPQEINWKELADYYYHLRKNNP